MKGDRTQDDASATRWSRLAAGDHEYLVKRYWSPVRRFFAARLPPGEEAEDVTQELFLGFVQRDLAELSGRIQGPFRRYLFRCARNMLADLHRARRALRRDAARTVALEGLEQALAAPGDEAASFDREWCASVLNRTRRRVRERCRREGTELAYRAFHLYYFGDRARRGRWTQQQVAQELGIPPTQVNNHVHRTRARFADALRAEVALYVGAPQEIEEEIRALLETHADLVDLSSASGSPPRSDVPQKSG